MTRHATDQGLPQWVRSTFWLAVSVEWAMVLGMVGSPVVLWFTILRSPPDAPGVRDRLTASRIRRIQVGDTEARVRALLGRSVWEEERTPTTEFPVTHMYFYRRRGPWSLVLNEGRLYVYFDRSNKVVQVFAESGDDGVYGLGLPPPTGSWEHTVAFAATFPDASEGPS
jgi:hypothetical protein